MINRPPKKKSLVRLRNLLAKVESLKSEPHNSFIFSKWHRDAQLTVANTFGYESLHFREIQRVSFTPMIVSVDTSDATYQSAYLGGLQRIAALLIAMADEVEEYWEDGDEEVEAIAQKPDWIVRTKKVFIVHGHDNAAKEAVARYLEKLGLTPVVLHELPNKGRTIIEKFEDYSDVGFAVVLLTPDDEGGLRTQPSNRNPRARQNVVLELGYFLGAIGRERVCALKSESVEIPSDYEGVVFTEFDEAGGWKLQLAGELKACGFDIDANLLIST